MDVNGSSFISKLIAESKKVSEINTTKVDYENKLRQLTTLKNFADIVKNGKSSSVITLSAKLISSSNSTEMILITLQSVCCKPHQFTFDPNFWQFSFNFCNGRQVSTWTLEAPLKPGNNEKFCTSWPLNVGDFSPVEVTVSVIFTMEWAQKKFVKVMQITKLVIDILYYLDPGRKTCDSHMVITTPSPLDILINETTTKEMTSKKIFPPVKMFELNFDSTLRDVFIKEILLAHSHHRGFELEPSDMVQLTEFDIYVQNDKITVSQNVEKNIVYFKSANPQTLLALKAAIIQRLLRFNNLKVLSPNDENCEKLYKLKFKISEMTSSSGDCTMPYAKLMELYLQLRDVTESIQFTMVLTVDD